MRALEANFDGLVGPTHNYAGIAPGNLASEQNKHDPSNPKLAALQGLAKMHALAQRGFLQGLLPPQERPDLVTLRALGFSGSDAQVLDGANKRAPQILAACFSAASMWAANAATVSPSADTQDGKVHFTAANLVSNLHRSIEHRATSRALRTIFADLAQFVHHAALPSSAQLSDEGAANHCRFCAHYGSPGIELFVYGRNAFFRGPAPARYVARQSREASETVARLHGLREDAVLFAQQSPEAIDQGVFHNDVITLSNRNVLFCHERAFIKTAEVVARLKDMLGDTELQAIVVRDSEVTVSDAVDSYMFNGQLLSRPQGGMLLIVPEECRLSETVWSYLRSLVGEGLIAELLTFDLRQSMRNGGGPACLRLRVVLSEQQRSAIRCKVFLDQALYLELVDWVERNYRDRLSSEDLADPALLDEGRRALDELTLILGLGSLYSFQQ